MSFCSLFNTDDFKYVFAEIENFTYKKLKNYNDYLETINLSKRNKEIFDAVWGNIEFSAGEIYILDSPLLQRLRKIKQLGLASFVYCGSDYSRFYHTIGVVFLADRMAEALNKCDMSIEINKPYFKSVVRLAAIFHDIGHMFLSHVSEHYFGKSPLYPRNETISNMLETFEKHACKRVALHELLGCMMVNTSEVKRLIMIVKNRINAIPLNDNNDIDTLIEYISGLIVGVPVDRAMLPYSNIINGPIDADKCDYLSRDSHVTRVPVAVDISRLTQKLSVVPTKDINMSSLWHTESDSNIPYYELAMSDSAEKALFQLCIARTIMFDSVYYHHKVLTAETELRELLNQLSNMEEPIFTSFNEILEYADDDFNKYFFEKIQKSRNDKDKKTISEVQKKFEKLYERNLAKRIICIMPDFLEGTQSNKEKLFDDILTSLNSKQEKNLQNNIIEQYKQICDILDKTDFIDDDCSVFIIQSPTNVYGHSNIQVPINLYNGNKREFRGYELVNSRDISSSASYIVANSRDNLIVFMATEKVLYQTYHIKLKAESSACGKFDIKLEREYYDKLINAGYYNDTPDLIKKSILRNYISDNKIKNIKDKFSSYEGPNGYKINEEEISYFFKQILCLCETATKARIIMNGIYEMLIKANFINRFFFSQSFSSFLETNGLSSHKLTVVPLGGSKDSAKHLMYYFNDVNQNNLEIKESLKEALEEDNNNILVFYDDGSYFGKQMISIMQEYMDIPIEKRSTHEHHVKPLDEELKDKLKEKTIIFYFLLFNSENLESTKKQLEEIGLKNIRFAFSQNMDKKIFEDDILFTDEDQKTMVKDFLSEIGYAVLKSSKCKNGTYSKGWDEERICLSALGYNDSQQMVFLQASVPTYTITAFWQEGIYNSLKWKPLFHRTKKK